MVLGYRKPDRPDGWQTGIRTKLAGLLHIEPYEWSAIGAWAWGLERMAGDLQAEPGVDNRRIIVIAHSRGSGRLALWAGANDPVFAMVVDNEVRGKVARRLAAGLWRAIAIISRKFQVVVCCV